MLAVAAATIVGLVAAEAGLREAGYRPPRRNLTQFSKDIMLDAPGLPYLYRPNSAFALQWPSNPTGYFRFGSNSLIFHTNNAGFRGPDFSRARDRKTRVAMIGDSLCWGQGVTDEDVVSAVLERELNRLSGDDNFEVYNFGLTSYQTRDEVELFDRVVRLYRPDVVVVWFFLNDFFSTGQLGGWGVVGNRNLIAWARERSVVLDTIITPVDEWLTSRVMARAYRDTYRPDSPLYQEGYRQLDRLQKLCAKDHIILVLAIHPILYQLDDRYQFGEVHRLMVETANKLDLPVVDMFPWFKGRKDRELWVHPVDWHPNQIAHAIAGENFAPALLAIIGRNRPYFDQAKAAKLTASAAAALPAAPVVPAATPAPGGRP